MIIDCETIDDVALCLSHDLTRHGLAPRAALHLDPPNFEVMRATDVGFCRLRTLVIARAGSVAKFRVAETTEKRSR